MPISPIHRSEEMQDILSQPPSYILRWGLGILVLLLSGLVVGSCFIYYPEKVLVTVKFSGTASGVNVYAPINGQVAKYFVRNEQQINAGERLLVMQTSGDFESILALEKDLLSSKSTFHEFSTFEHQRLGTVQTGFALYLQALKKLADFHAQTTFRNQNEANILAQKRTVSEVNAAYQNQASLILQEKALLEQEKLALRELVKEGLIAKRDTQKVDAQLIQKELELKRHYQTQLQQESNALGYEKELAQLNQNTWATLQQIQLEIATSKQRLLADITQWKHQAMLFAPVAGKVVIFEKNIEKQYVKADSVLLSILPSDAQYSVKAALPVKEISKIKKGQKVNIRLENYDYQRFGMIEAEVQNIILLPQGNMYNIEMHLPQGLTTTYHKTLAFYPEMQGQAEIITEKRILLSYLFQFLNR